MLTATRDLARSRTNKGYAIAITGIIIWSTTAVFIRFLTEHRALPPLQLAAWRDLIACLTLVLVLAVFKPGLLRLPKGQLRFILPYGLVLGFYNAVWTISVALNGASISVVLVYSSAAYTALVAWRLFGEKLTPAKSAAVLLSLGGCALAAGAFRPEIWGSNAFGLLVGLISGIAMSAYSLAGKESARRGINSWTALTYTFGVAALLLILFNFSFPHVGNLSLGDRAFVPNLDPTGWMLLILLAVGPTIGGYGLYTLAMNYLQASIVNLMATLEPTFTAALSYFFLNERLTIEQISGGLMVIAAVVMLGLQKNGDLDPEGQNPKGLQRV